MRSNHFRVLTFLLLVSTAGSQTQPLPASLIETIAGSEDGAVAGTEFSFGGIAGLATDAVGNTYFTIQARSRVYRLGVDGRVTVYAGNGVRGEHREGALAVASPLLNPAALAVDAVGNLFVRSWHSLLRVDASNGRLSTVFSTPYKQPGSSNSILDAGDMTVGSDGLLYLCDGGTIKSYSFASGSIRVLAGNGKLETTRPGGTATSSPLKYPQSVAVAPDGTVYFSTIEPNVFRIRQDGSLESVNIQLNRKGPPLGEYDIPSHIALDGLGNLFVAQANRSQILRLDLKSGLVSVYAGTGSQQFNGDDIKALQSSVAMPTYVVADSAGNLIVAEQYRIRRVDTSSKRITTIVGNGLPVADDAGAPASHAKLWEPAYAIPVTDGTVYITSSFSHRLLRLGSDGELTTVAGGGNPIRGEEPGNASRVALNYPQGIWPDENGDVYFSDYGNRIVRRLAVQTGLVSNFAKTPKNFNSASGTLDLAGALVADSEYLYMSDPSGHRVWRISKRDGSVEPYVGNGSNASSWNATYAKSIRLTAPSGLALDSSRNLYVADAYFEGKQGRILRVDATDGRVATILSNLRQPSGLAFQSPNVLCFSETGASQVRCVNLTNNSILVVAGTGVAGFAGDGGPAECAQLNRPTGISFDQQGNLYIADTGNQRVRRVRIGTNPVQCHN